MIRYKVLVPSMLALVAGVQLAAEEGDSQFQAVLEELRQLRQELANRGETRDRETATILDEPTPAIAGPGPSTGTIVITPLRRESDLERSSGRVEVIDGDDLRLRGNPSRLRDQLANRPGVMVRSDGSYGGLTTLSLRGTSSGDTRILVDGLPVIDSTGIAMAMDMARISTVGVQHSEIAFGPQSGLYGSSAIGGVINLTTLRPTVTPEHQLRLEAGSMNTYLAEGSSTGPIGNQWGYALSVRGMRSSGISATYDASDPNAALGDPGNFERDGVEEGGLRGRLQWSPHLDGVFYIAVDQQFARTDFDGGWPVDPDDAESRQRTRDLRLSGGGQWALSDDLTVSGDLLWSDNRRTYPHETAADRRYFDGQVWYAQARASYQVDAAVVVDLGLDGERQSMDMDSDTRSVRNIGAWSTLTVDERDYVLSITGRHDFHQNEGDATTFRVAGGWFFFDNRAKLHAAVGTAFRAPSLFQLYSAFGNEDLKAERSVGYEWGLTLRPTEWLRVEGTWYRTDYREKIGFDMGTFRYANEASDSQITGYDVRVIIDPEDSPWRLSAYYNPQRARAQSRVPAYLAGAEASYQWSATWLTAGLRHVGEQNATVDPYTVVYAAAGWKPRPSVELYIRGENLNDEDYVENPGFTTLRPSAWVGMIADF